MQIKLKYFFSIFKMFVIISSNIVNAKSENDIKIVKILQIIQNMKIKIKYLLSILIMFLIISYHIDPADVEYDNKNY